LLIQINVFARPLLQISGGPCGSTLTVAYRRPATRLRTEGDIMATKSFELPLQAIVDTHKNTHPWYMSGSASIDASGSLRTTTRLESHIALSGFTGGMLVALLNSNGQAIYTTPILQYGVDGYDVPSWLGGTPSPRNVSANFQLNPGLFEQVDRININLFHAPKNRLGAVLSQALPIVIEIVKWIIALYGSSDSSTVVSSTSSSLIGPVSDGGLKSGAKYTIHVPSGQFLTATNGGGIGESGNKLPLHTDATRVGPWEKFKFVKLTRNVYAIQTVNGHYLTAINAGGIGEAANKLPLHTDATRVGPWEVFQLDSADSGYFTIRTANGHYLTAVNGGGIGEGANKLPLHTDATRVGPWEKFTLLQQ
jgi:hypothetical protein